MFRRVRSRHLVALASLALCFGSTLACDPGKGVTYENKTGQTITVLRNGDIETTLAPGEKKTFTFIEYDGTRMYSARDSAGAILFTANYSWDDLRRLGWRIVIEP